MQVSNARGINLNILDDDCLCFLSTYLRGMEIPFTAYAAGTYRVRTAKRGVEGGTRVIILV